ncbi:hypothetical protein AZZ97_005187, partial [Klebsiella pneumoniae]
SLGPRSHLHRRLGFSLGPRSHLHRRYIISLGSQFHQCLSRTGIGMAPVTR